jgi:hypothetical protein
MQLLEKVTTIRSLSVLFAACLMAVLALPVTAGSPKDEEVPERRAPEIGNAEPVTIRAMRVIYDQETGDIISVPIRETGFLSAPLAKALTRSAEGLQVFELENGGMGVHLGGRFQHVLMVRVRPDGSFETVCTNHEHVAEKFMRGDPEVVAAEPRDK